MIQPNTSYASSPSILTINFGTLTSLIMDNVTFSVNFLLLLLLLDYTLSLRHIILTCMNLHSYTTIISVKTYENISNNHPHLVTNKITFLISKQLKI